MDFNANTIPLYTKDLSVLGFWHPWGWGWGWVVLDPVPGGY